MEKLHIAHFVAQFYFRDGYMQGSIAKHVGVFSSERACAVYVQQQYREAPGATWFNKSDCWAEFGENRVQSSVHRTCHFHGTLLLLS